MNFAIGNWFPDASPRLQQTSLNNIPSNSGHSNVGSTSDASQSLESDLGSAVELFKENSLVYQLLRAIASQQSDETASNDSNVEQNLYSFSESVSRVFEFEISSTSITSNNGFSIESEFSLSASISQSESQTVQFNFGDQSIEINIQIESSSTFSFSMSNTVEEEVSDPIILNLNNTDFGFNTHSKVQFDLDADGKMDKISTLSAGNVFLAFDANQNGVIDNGHELFGDTKGHANGFQDLAQYDQDGNGVIDANDEIFSQLLLVDFRADGEQVIDAISSNEIESLNLNYTDIRQEYRGDNLLVAESTFSRKDGSLGRAGDFLLRLG